MNIATIFAGGVGSRMRTQGVPKQFLKVFEKPILVYTLERFQENRHIDAIVLASLPEYIEYTWNLAKQFGITKLKKIVPGGANGQGSIYNALNAAKEVATESGVSMDDTVVLIHDGVRPLIDDELIDLNIETVRTKGNAITCVECKETVSIVNDNGEIVDTVQRDSCRIARAPQSFFLSDILGLHEQALKDGVTNAIDSCSLMKQYGRTLHIAMGKSENIKITTPEDYYVFKAALESRTNSAVFS